MTELTRRSLLAGAAVAARPPRCPVGASRRARRRQAGRRVLSLQDRQLRADRDPRRRVDCARSTTISSQCATRGRRSQKAMADALMAPASLADAVHPARGQHRLQARADRHRHRRADCRRRRLVHGTISRPPASTRRAIDTILISHFHPDHINGIRDKDGAMVFPNAEIQVPAAEWAYWMDDANMGKAPEARTSGLAQCAPHFRRHRRQGVKFEPGKELAPGITVAATPGHTPGPHRRSSSRRATSRCWCSATSPTIRICSCAIRTGRARSTPTARRRSRRARRCSTAPVVDRMLVQGYHFPFPASGYVIKTGATPTTSSPVIVAAVAVRAPRGRTLSFPAHPQRASENVELRGDHAPGKG